MAWRGPAFEGGCTAASASLRRKEPDRVALTAEEPFRALYNKYRPQAFAEVVGQKHVVQILQNSLAHNRVSHAYLFSGERGTGKTTVGRLLAKAVNCLEGIQPEPCNRCTNCLNVGRDSFLDLIEIDAASNTSVDDIRQLRENVRFRPSSGRYKVYLIDEVHQLSRAAYNAFLKTLEEPPDHAIFILATTDPHRVLPTVRSRCQHLRFRRHTQKDMVEELARVARGEGASASRGALNLIARNSEGSLRDAIGLLDQALSYSQEELTEGTLRQMLGLTGTDFVASFAEAIADGATGASLELIDRSIQDGANPATLQEEMVDYLRGLLLVKTGRREQNLLRFSEAETDEMMRLAGRFRVGQIVRALETFIEGRARRRAGHLAQLDLELAAAEVCMMMEREGGETKRSEAAASPVVRQRGGGPAALARDLPVGPAENQGDAAVPVEADEAPAGEGHPSIESPLEEIRSAVKLWKPLYAAYLQDARLHESPGKVVLELAYPTHFDALNMPENQRRLTEIIHGVLGKKIAVECRHSPSPQRAGEEARDRVVREAVNMYGAEIIED